MEILWKYFEYFCIELKVLFSQCCYAFVWECLFCFLFDIH